MSIDAKNMIVRLTFLCKKQGMNLGEISDILSKVVVLNNDVLYLYVENENTYITTWNEEFDFMVLENDKIVEY